MNMLSNINSNSNKHRIDRQAGTAFYPAWVCFFLFFILCAGLLFADTDRSGNETLFDSGALKVLTLEQVIAMTAKQNPAVTMAANQVESARQDYNRRQLQTGPRFKLVLDPIYRLSHGLPPGGGPVDGPLYTHSAGAGLNYSQFLPGGGQVSAGLQHEINIAMENDDLNSRQSPALFMNLFQPLFSEGRFINPSAGRTTQELAELNWQSASVSYQQELNSTIIQGVELFLQVHVFRSFQAVTKETIRLAETRLQDSREDLSLGLLAEADVLEQEIMLGRQQELLLDNQYRLLQAEQALARAIGYDGDLETVSFKVAFDAADTANMVERTDMDMGNMNMGTELLSRLDRLGLDNIVVRETAARNLLDETAEVKSTLLRARELQLRHIMERSEYNPVFSASFTIAPQYPPPPPPGKTGDGLPEQRDFADSFTDLFADDAYYRFSLSLGMEIPLFNAKEREALGRVQQKAVNNSRIQVEQARKRAVDSLKLTKVRFSMLADKVALLNRNVELLQKRFENQKELNAIGNITASSVDEAAVELQNKQNELYQAQAEYVVAAMQLYSMAGGSLERLVTLDH